MGAPGSGIRAGDQPAAETLLTAFKTIDAAERRRHASVLNYWLSIRGDKEFPPLHDLDPLELSDAGPNSALFELISGGHDAEIRHLGEALRGEGDWPEQIMDAPNPSILSSIAKKLPIVAISRDFLAFEDEFTGAEGKTRCWVTLLPLSAGGAWVDYVYALVSFDTEGAKAAKAVKTPAKQGQADEPEPEEAPEPITEAEGPVEAVERTVGEATDGLEPVVDEVEEPAGEVPAELRHTEAVAGEELRPLEAEAESDEQEPVASAAAKPAPGFSKLLDSIAGLTGFYGSQPVKVEPVIEEASEPADEAAAEESIEEAIIEEPNPIAEEPVAEEFAAEELIAEGSAAEEAPVDDRAPTVSKQPTRATEGTLQDKLTDVRTKADEARMAKLRANAALYEGLGAAYDFALDAEEAPEEYLRLVEAKGLKIQLRSPMKPVVRLAFDGLCDESTIKQLEAVLAWALDEELPRGSLTDRIEASGGIGPILRGEAKAA
jgi:hypothetical protein